MKHKRQRCCAINGKVHLCGVWLDALSMAEVIGRIGEAIENRTPLMISMVNVAKLVKMRRDALLRESVQSGQLVLADGMPLVWLSRLKGDPLPERVAGIDLMYRLFSLADERGLRVFLLGATPQTLERVVQLACRRYPRMNLAGYRDGYFTGQEEADVARAVRRARPDILLVAISSPKKELFMQRWGRFMRVPVCHGVGGSFDVMAGLTRRAPVWMQRSGLEWLFRLAQEPARMWRRYLISNTVFVLLALREVAGQWLGRWPGIRSVPRTLP